MGAVTTCTACFDDTTDFDVDRTATRRLVDGDSDTELEEAGRRHSASKSKEVYYYDPKADVLVEQMEPVDV